MEKDIESAFDFLATAHKLKKDRDHPSQIEFYRGHSNKEWRLLPSIYRKPMLHFEENLINEFIRRRPNEFPENDGLFNVLAKMQHFGLHTRLLDVTENPAVALYFACCDNVNKDGEIFFFQQSLDEIPNNTVLNIITEFYIYHRDIGGNYKVKDYYDYVVKNHKARDVEMAFYQIANGYYCFSRPKIITERILRQAGSFMLCADEVCPKENCVSQKCTKRGTEQCKKDNIDQDIAERIKNLSIRGILCDNTDAHIKCEQNGLRYIVKANRKKEILSELQTIGINRAFLFPDLNNVGIDIMEDYNSRVT